MHWEPAIAETALEVFKDGRHLGQFRRGASEPVSFAYDRDYEGPPISLSLPLDGGATRNAAERFLDNLLPDNVRVRGRWARQLGTTEEPFELLAHMGEDLAGALVLNPEGQAPDSGSAGAVIATDDQIADRIASIIHDPDAWLAADQVGSTRLSLAGAQGKFTLARIGDDWFWPSAAVPSTHILKPAMQRLQQVPEAEAGALTLAIELGLDAPVANAVKVRGQSTFIVERFDRDTAQSVARRIHTEDFAQAVGRSPDQKYGMTPEQIIEVLGRHAAESEKYRFIRLLAFNVYLGNADAHAKNYSVFLDDEIRLTPLYDAVPTLVWPTLTDDRLAMKVGGALRSSEVQFAHWRKLANRTDLDEDTVVGIAEEIGRGIRDRSSAVFEGAGMSAEMLHRLESVVRSTTRHLPRG